MSIGYDGEASGEVDSTTASDPFGREERSLEEPVRFQELVEKWQMRWHGEQTGTWTYRLIPELATWLNREHGEVGFYLSQLLLSHSCKC